MYEAAELKPSKETSKLTTNGSRVIQINVDSNPIHLHEHNATSYIFTCLFIKLSTDIHFLGKFSGLLVVIMMVLEWHAHHKNCGTTIFNEIVAMKILVNKLGEHKPKNLVMALRMIEFCNTKISWSMS
ncbi:hypothetical protein G4B88_029004 [Cannabis sativa]|uniref:Uncharacterized protein n=1 Tax=Cannabis sativa TaxID=3483 RepID=A0A7J6HQU7_CANSA|nr:hypothetical protein G4B88_029004 [Cannabis sativa]